MYANELHHVFSLLRRNKTLKSNEVPLQQTVFIYRLYNINTVTSLQRSFCELAPVVNRFRVTGTGVEKKVHVVATATV